MKDIFSLFLFVALLQANGQNVTFTAKSGDAELDVTLSDMNVKATADFQLFKNEMKLAYNVTDQKLEYLKTTIKMAPADIYMTLEIGKITGKTVDAVTQCYQSNKSKGWGVIAKEMGIKPGSSEFHQLKSSAKGKNDKMKGNGNSHGNNGKGNGNGNGKGKGKK